MFYFSIPESEGSLKRARPISPVEITEEDYRKMLIKHHRQLLLADDDDDEVQYNIYYAK